MIKKKILIVGGSHNEIPLIKAAIELNLYVITTGNQPQGLGHQYSDEFHLVDYSDNEAIYNLAKTLQIDFICFGAHDLSIFSTVYTASKLGFKTFDNYNTTEIIHHKDKFKVFAQKHNLLTPKAYMFKTEHEAIEFAMHFPMPFIIKPIDMGGGKGIEVIYAQKDIPSAIQNAFQYSQNKRIIIEEFFEGKLHSFSTFIQDQKVVFHYADDEYECKDNPFGVCTSTSPASHFEDIKDTLLEQSNTLAKLLNLKDGLLHMQYLQKNNNVTIVEYTRRLPGDMYNIPVEKSTGIEYAKNIIRFACGYPVKIYFKPQRKFVSRHCIMAKSFNQVTFKEELKKYIFHEVIWNDTQGIDKKGIIFLEYNSHNEMISYTKDINYFISYLNNKEVL